VDATTPGSCLMEGFSINGVEPSDSTAKALVS
jgi:hypothetical protein